MKNYKNIMAGILAVVMLLCATPMVYATSEITSETTSEVVSESTDASTDVSVDSSEVTEPTEPEITTNPVDEKTTLNVEVGVDKTLEIPLTLTAERDAFYFCTNINPGDTMRATVIFKNDSNTEDTQIAVTDVINLLPDDLKALALLDLLELTISIDDSPIYKGVHSKVTKPVTGWINVPIGESVAIDIEIYFPKEADNRYQNANMKVEWVFQARGDVPPDPEEVETGDESNRNFGMYFLSGAALVGLAGYGLILLKKKKSEKEETN